MLHFAGDNALVNQMSFFIIIILLLTSNFDLWFLLFITTFQLEQSPVIKVEWSWYKLVASDKTWIRNSQLKSSYFMEGALTNSATED